MSADFNSYNWWSLIRKTSCWSKLNYSQFLSILDVQIKKKIDLKNNLLFNEMYVLDEFKTIFEQHQFNDLVQKIETTEQQYEPLLTFHASNSVDNINSIVRNGYLMPGQVHPEKGYSLRMRNGNYFGDGIYSTTEFETAEWFTFLDNNKSIQLIVNLMLPGKVHYIEKTKDFDKNTWNFTASIVNDVYVDGTHSRTPDYRTWISASNKYIIPLVLITMRPKHDHSKMKTYLIDNKTGVLTEPKCFIHQQLLIKDPVYFYQIFDNYYVINASKQTKEQNNLSKIVHHIILPTTQKLKKTYSDFINGINVSEDKYLTLYSPTYFEKHKINTNDSVHTYMNAFDTKDHKTKNSSIFNALDDVFHSIELETSANNIHVIYLCCNSSINQVTNELNNFIPKHDMYLKSKRVLFKLVYMNDNNIDNDTILALNHMKYRLQTYTFFELFANYVSKSLKLETVFDNILKENENIVTHVLNYAIPYPLGVAHDGFVVTLHEQPFWNTNTNESVIYKGTYIKAIRVDGRYYTTKFMTTDELLLCESNNQNQNDLLIACKTIVQLLCKFRNYLMIYPERIQAYNLMICKLFEQLSTYVDKIKTISNAKTYYYQIRAILNELKTYTNVKFSGKWFEQVLKMKFGQKIIKRVHHHVSLEDVQKLVPENTVIIHEPSDAIAFCNKQGYLISVHRESCSEIEPWLLVIKSVSASEKGSVGEIYKKNEMSGDDDEYNDVLLLHCDNVIEKMYLSYIFTRNPYLQIVGQQAALITISFVKSIEDIFLSSRSSIKTATSTSNEKMIQVVELYNAIKLMFENDQRMMQDVLLNIMTHENNECYLTELYDIQSVCKIIGVLCTNKASLLFTENRQKYHRFAFALLAECVMRSCKVKIKTSKLDENTIIQQVLGLNTDTILEQYKFDLQFAAKKSGVFYRKSYTNCSPFAVVACLEFLERLHTNNQTIDDVIKAFDRKEITMKGFLNKHMKNKADGITTQVALYLQGLRYNKANKRTNIHFDNPEKIIQDIVHTQIEFVRKRQIVMQTLINKQNEKHSQTMRKYQIYLEYHNSLPNIFDVQEVDELNKTGKYGHIELMKNGLLKHHCCFSSCPDYLVSFETPDDKKNNTRKGLYKHLSADQYLKQYIPNFHNIFSMHAKHTNSYEEFIVQLRNTFENNKVYQTLDENELKQTWDQYKRKKN